MRRQYEGQHRSGMDALIAAGKTPGCPEGPEEARGCDQCKFGIVSQPEKLNSCGVPFFVARAMARDIGSPGLCHVVYCDCIAGKRAEAYDATTRIGLEDIHGTTTMGKVGHVAWAHKAPKDYLPGTWWANVQEACNA